MIAAQPPLAPGEARVFYAWSAPLTSPELSERCRVLLSDEEQARAQRFRFVEDQQTYLLAHALTRSLLAELCGVAPRALRFENGAHGRPELAWPERTPPLRFNLSHTRGLVACAVALEHDVGVDVEHADRRVDIDQLARSVFSDAERAALARLEGDARRARFFELWTLKEAYIKAVGKGLALRLQAISLELDALPVPRIAFAAPVEDDPQAWSLHVERPGPGHTLAVALRVSEPLRLSVEGLVL
jgi:4'-phosphopantetheinyl transferase